MANNIPNKLDFICIGAAKSGTTTLDALLKRYPELYLPAEKEVPYYSDDRTYKKGLKWFLRQHFGQAKLTQCIGKITPQYMLENGDHDARKVPERVYEDNPETKIIAILRSPIQRTFSDYKMQCARGYETRSFRVAVFDTLENEDAYRQNPSLSNSYVFNSEYGRILSAYYDVFPAVQILVLFTEDLRRDPDEVQKKILRFLGIKVPVKSARDFKDQRVGGDSPKIRLLSPGYLYRLPYVKSLWRGVVPEKLRRPLEYRLNKWNTKADNKKIDIDSPEYKRLKEHYDSDVGLLSSLINAMPPWPDFD